MTRQKLVKLPSIGLGRVRHALGDGATEEQAKRVHRLLDSAGLLGGDVGRIPPGRLVGLAEFAAIMNRTPQAVRAWKLAPEPIVRLKAGPIWDRQDVERFRLAHPELCGVTS